MAYKRKRAFRPFKRVTKRKTFARRKRMYRRAGVTSVKRTFYLENFNFDPSNTNGFWRLVGMNAVTLPSFAEFQAVFDEYKINAIKFTYRPRYDTVVAGTGGANIQCFAHTVIDPASTVVPAGTYSQATLNSFMENSGVRTHTLNKPFSVYYKPKVEKSVSNGVNQISTQMSPMPWCKTSAGGIALKGHHIFLQQNNFSNQSGIINLDTYVTLYMQFKNLK